MAETWPAVKQTKNAPIASDGFISNLLERKRGVDQLQAWEFPTETLAGEHPQKESRNLPSNPIRFKA